MFLQKSEGFIIKSRLLRDADKMITLYTKQYGKMNALAKGVRKITSKFASNLEIFNYNELVMYKKEDSDIATITGCNSRKSFHKIRNDFFKMMKGAYMVELVDKFTCHYNQNSAIFYLINDAFLLMDDIEYTNKDVLQLVEAFIMRLLSYSGYKLHLDKCVVCGSSIIDVSCKFSSQEGGVVCSECRVKDNYALDVSALMLGYLRKLQSTDLAHVKKLPTSELMRYNVKRVLDACINNHIITPLRSEEFMHKMKSANLSIAERG